MTNDLELPRLTQNTPHCVTTESSTARNVRTLQALLDNLLCHIPVRLSCFECATTRNLTPNSPTPRRGAGTHHLRDELATDGDNNTTVVHRHAIHEATGNNKAHQSTCTREREREKNNAGPKPRANGHEAREREREKHTRPNKKLHGRPNTRINGQEG